MIGAYAVDDITIVRATLDQWGEVSSSTSTVVRGRVDWRFRKVLDNGGAERTVRGRILTATEVLLTDRLTIGSETYSVVAVNQIRGFGDPYFYEVYVA